MADFPTSVYVPREVTNLPGLVLDPLETANLFAEDVNLPNAEIVAIETTLGLSPQGAYASVAARLAAFVSSAWTAVTGGISYTAGNVGIGTASPGYKLQVVGSAYVGGDVYASADGSVRLGDFYTEKGLYRNGRLDIRTDSAGDIVLQPQGGNLIVTQAAGELLRVTAAGNLGIGNTAPTALLQVGSASQRGFKVYGNNTPYGVALGGDTGGWAYGYSFEGNAGTALGGFGAFGDNDTLSQYYIGTYANQRVTILTGGNVGIGTTTPNAKFVVSAVTAAYATDFAKFEDAWSNNGLKITSNANGPVFQSYAVSSGVVQPLLINPSGGNVGIGTTVPKSKLHVVGLPVYANNAAAVSGGLTAGAFYRTGADPDPVCVVH